MNDSMKMFYEANAAREQVAAAQGAIVAAGIGGDTDPIYKEIANNWRKSLFGRDDADPVSGQYAMNITQALAGQKVVAVVHDEVMLQAQVPEPELITLRRLAEKYGMVLMDPAEVAAGLPGLPSETVLTEGTGLACPGLTMVAALGGVRMGCAAWHND